MIAWTLPERTAVARIVEAITQEHGFHTIVSSYCFHLGDPNIVVYPQKTTSDKHIQPLIDALSLAGFLDWEKFAHGYHGNSQTAYKTYYFGKRIDFFFRQ